MSTNARTEIVIPSIVKRIIPGLVKSTIKELIDRKKRTTPQPYLSYLILNILDHCNLNCISCDHFAAIAKERFVSSDKITCDIARMAELFNDTIGRIAIMGGEPLLHPQLKEILIKARMYFPNTLIQLVTNGILLLKQDVGFWTVCRENNIVIVNTKYPIELDYDAICNMAKKYEVIFEYRNNTEKKIKTMYKIPLDISGVQNPRKSFSKCFHANSCVLLMEGKIYTCTIAPNIHIFNENFNTHMELEAEDYLCINAVNSKEDILKFLCVPKPFCRYCNVSKRSFGIPWEKSKKIMNEWLV
jgi:hypothetical protein